MQKLLLHPKPYDDETLTGYLLRLSLKNICNPKYIFSRLNYFSGKRINNYFIDIAELDPHDLLIISELTNNNLERILDLIIKQNSMSNQSCLFNEKVIPLFAVCTRKAKVCPICLSENEYHRKIWCLVTVTACPHHKVMLIDSCEVCYERLSWAKGNIFRCSCGHMHKKTKGVGAVKECLKISEIMFRKLGILESNSDNHFNEPFSCVDINCLICILTLLLRQLYKVRDSRSFAGINFSLREYADLQSQVLEIIESWPKGYHSFLDNIRSNQKYYDTEGNKAQIYRDFGEFYVSIFSDKNNTYEILKLEFIEYIKKHIDEYSSASLFRILNKNEITFLGLVDAAKYLSIGTDKLTRLIENNVIIGFVPKEKNMKYTYVYKTSIDSYINNIRENEYLSYNEAQDYLGIMLGLDDMVNHKLLVFHFEDHDYSKTRFISKVEIDNLMFMINGKVVIKEDYEIEKIPFAKVIDSGRALKGPNDYI
ncbi:TniQ family protein [Paenibacillus sp.]|uniref:TniQ family protein n=1 Tax=Paenibacillus sp. TaxID=58172 RepID=UPI0028A5C015|nr:TniQ family protein [Paenibacillus sp.]